MTVKLFTIYMSNLKYSFIHRVIFENYLEKNPQI